MKILVIGGAGYIGSHMVKLLSEKSCDLTILDDLSTGHASSVLAGELVIGNFGNSKLLDSLLCKHFDVIMHFAAFSQVEGSVLNPGDYYQNNVLNTHVLLEGMRRHKLNNLIFSSTAAVYGNPVDIPIDEAHQKAPINPYGKSKWMVEQMLNDYRNAYGLNSISLRYFNASGADPLAQIGERHHPETHLIPLVLQTASGQREAISIFGRNHPTGDGTCVRDYVHVEDVCDAHWLALKFLMSGGLTPAFNIGYGIGYSVEQVIDECLRITNRTFKVIEANERIGDPAILIANSDLIRRQLGWSPKYKDLSVIIEHAWNWEMKQHGSVTI